ncbi:hypothetical protein WA026_021323 [Henosepilachna vigintioctopunctata]|uniref:Uncharacterized protein n=1 Tax=Henosepilachna vigintioctopunctata TaxID=420089 RepID=A0AAW1UB54_9CUCU
MRRLLHRRYDQKLKLEIKQLTNEINQTINSIKSRQWEEALRQAEKQTNKMWEITRRLENSTENNNIPPIHGINGLQTTNDGKAEAIAETFEKTHRLKNTNQTIARKNTKKNEQNKNSNVL